MHGSGPRNLKDGAASERHGAESSCYVLALHHNEDPRHRVVTAPITIVQGPNPFPEAASLRLPDLLENAYLGTSPL